MRFPHLETENKETNDVAALSSQSTQSVCEFLTLPANGSLPSIIGSEEELGGVRIRAIGADSWSNVYPLSTRLQEWNRPQLLAEVRVMIRVSCRRFAWG